MHQKLVSRRDLLGELTALPRPGLNGREDAGEKGGKENGDGKEEYNIVREGEGSDECSLHLGKQTDREGEEAEWKRRATSGE